MRPFAFSGLFVCALILNTLSGGPLLAVAYTEGSQPELEGPYIAWRGLFRSTNPILGLLLVPVGGLAMNQPPTPYVDHLEWATASGLLISILPFFAGVDVKNGPSEVELMFAVSRAVWTLSGCFVLGIWGEAGRAGW